MVPLNIPLKSKKLYRYSKIWLLWTGCVMKQTPENDRFTYRISRSEEDGEYVGLCAEFPSLSWLGSTPEGALRGIRRVVADVVADMQQR